MKSDLKYLLIIIKPTEFTIAEFLLYKARNQQSEKGVSAWIRTRAIGIARQRPTIELSRFYNWRLLIL